MSISGSIPNVSTQANHSKQGCCWQSNFCAKGKNSLCCQLTTLLRLAKIETVLITGISHEYNKAIKSQLGDGALTYFTKKIGDITSAQFNS